jgi:hypothetical protein
VVYNDNNFGFGFNIKNTNTGAQALTGYGINNAAGSRVGQFVFVPPAYTAAALRDTLLFSSAGPTTALGFVSSADGSGKPDIFFRAGTGPDLIRIKGASGNVGIGTATPQSTLQVNGYIQLSTVTGAPPAADCDAVAELGRMKVDPVGFNLYICTSAGWKSAALQ